MARFSPPDRPGRDRAHPLREDRATGAQIAEIAPERASRCDGKYPRWGAVLLRREQDSAVTATSIPVSDQVRGSRQQGQVTEAPMAARPAAGPTRRR